MTLIADAPSELNGRERLETMMHAPRRPGIVDTLDFDLIEVDDGRVVFEGTPSRAVYNPIGTVHGGYAAALLDSACGCAVQSKLSASQGYTTLELKVAYHRAMTDATGPVRAEGKVVTMGRRAAFVEATLKGLDGKLYASATSTLLVFER
jgi:uncharacterized protein (TIGR00369 family)